MKLLLAIIARLSFKVFEPLLLFYSIFRILIFNKFSFKERKNLFNNYFWRVALTFDQTSNVVGDFFLNDTMSKSKLTYFGNEDETISYAMAQLERDDNLTEFGKTWAEFLDSVDKDHLKKALTNNEN
tara:strand:- start:10456 stop:10836 length:381 start_codon:yes stop_codon:yes gene_type:complete